jgi:CheY-like chemotaxis protein
MPKTITEMSKLEEPHRILFVEDNVINQRVLARKLKIAGFEVTTANNGQEALDAWISACWFCRTLAVTPNMGVCVPLSFSSARISRAAELPSCRIYVTGSVIRLPQESVEDTRRVIAHHSRGRLVF